MDDEVGNDGRFRPCLHTSSSWEFDAPVLICYNYCSYAGNSYANEVLSSEVAQALTLQTAPEPDMVELSEEALAFMMPRLNEGTSLVNFIYELKDVKRMVSPKQFLLRKRVALKQLADPSTRKSFIKELIQKLTGAHLNASFGIVPFVRDIVQMHDDLISLRYRLARLKKFAGTRQTRHYRRYLPGLDGKPSTRDRVTVTTTDTWQNPWRGDGAYVAPFRPLLLKKQWSRWVRRPVYHASMRYSYTLPDMTKEEERAATLLDTLGVRLDPGILWNATPWTFLIDWVVDGSSFLRGFARDNFPITTVIHEFCHSMAYSKECGVDCVLTDRGTLAPRPASPNGNTTACVARNFTRFFNRVLAHPSQHAAHVRGIRLRQAALAGSLLLNNSRRIYQRY
jgi:hypothetical protein